MINKLHSFLWVTQFKLNLLIMSSILVNSTCRSWTLSMHTLQYKPTARYGVVQMKKWGQPITWKVSSQQYKQHCNWICLQLVFPNLHENGFLWMADLNIRNTCGNCTFVFSLTTQILDRKRAGMDLWGKKVSLKLSWVITQFVMAMRGYKQMFWSIASAH